VYCIEGLTDLRIYELFDDWRIELRDCAIAKAALGSPIAMGTLNRQSRISNSQSANQFANPKSTIPNS
jgi:hypothetical protein